ncbi:MAG TPA: chemotaxis protein CheA, partial [Oscillatoriaceae cyanobacterium]
NELLLSLERSDDPELVHDLFRTAHSFKGMASTMGYRDLAELAHGMEGVLDALRSRTLAAEPSVVDLLLRSVDALETQVDEVSLGRSPGLAAAELLGELAAIAERGRPAPSAPVQHIELSVPERPSGPMRLYTADVTLDSACVMKSVRALMITSALETIAEVLSITPSFEELEWGDQQDAFQVLLRSGASRELIAATLCEVGEVAEVVIEERAEEGELALDAAQCELLAEARADGRSAWRVAIALMPGSRMKSVRAAMVMRALSEFGHVLATQPELSALEGERFGDSFSLVLLSGAEPPALQNCLLNIAEIDRVQIAAFDGETASPSPEISLKVPQRPAFREAMPTSRRQSVRVPTERIDALMSLVGELMAERGQLLALSQAHPVIAPLAARLDHVAGQLHHEMLRLRLVPLETIFSRFPRMVRDVARELGKEVDFVVSGQHTELDRLIVDGLGDPLVHLLRNALDHGLETPEEREASGKPREGHLRLAAHQEGAFVVITLSDDGRGFDYGRVLAKARERGLWIEGSGPLTSERLLEIICAPGFSTSRATTAISGRGVGMDVVKTRLDALGGALSLETVPGEGSTFRLQLPLSRTLIQAVLADVGGEIYGIPAGQVEEVLDADGSADVALALATGECLPFVDLRERFELEARVPATLLVVRTATQRMAIAIDRLVGRQEVSVKPMSPLLGELHYLSGAALLGDGRVALIIDPARLVG